MKADLAPARPPVIDAEPDFLLRLASPHLADRLRPAYTSFAEGGSPS